MVTWHPKAEVEEDVEVPVAPTLPSPSPVPSPPLQAQPAPSHDTLPQEQTIDTSESSMTLLITLMETCVTLSQKVAELEQDKQTQASEILKLKKRVKKLEKKKKSKHSGRMHPNRVGGIEAIDVDEDITLVDAKTQVDMDAELQGRKDDNNTATKDVNTTEPTVFDDEEVTMTMAQTLIKMKDKKARLLDEKIAKRLHDEEVEQAAAREKQEKDDLEKAKGLQQLKYQSLKRKPVSIAQARKNMIIYLKNMAGYKMEHFKEEPQKERVAKETLLQESFKKLKAVEVLGSESTQDTPTNDPEEMSEENVQSMLEIVPMTEFKVEAL
nr:hypothetical protein [Tanacetum cinerariifolium]